MKTLTMLTKTAKFIALCLCGVLCALIILEAVLQAAAFISAHTRQKARPIELENGRKQLTVMCIGESMTVQHLESTYTQTLEKILREKYPDTNINIVNKGITRSTSFTSLQELVPNLERYHPQVVIAMLGINDVQTFFTKDHIKTRVAPSWTNSFLSIYLLKSLYLDYKNRRKFSDKADIKFKNFDEQMDYYLQEGFRSYFLDKDYPLLDRKMLNLANDDFSKKFWEAKNLLNKQENRSAVPLLDEASKLNPSRPEPYVIMHIALMQMKILPDPKLKQLCRKNCKDELAFLRTWGMWHQQYEAITEAVRCYKEGIKLAKTPEQKIEFEAMWADALKQNGLKRLAMRKMLNVLEKDPNNLLALRNVAFTYYELDLPLKARPYLEKLQKLDPDVDSTYDALGCIYNQIYKADTEKNADMLEKAQKMLELASIKSPGMDFGGNKLLGVVYSKRNDPDITRQNEQFRHNYLSIYDELQKRGIQLIAMQYPRRSVEDLKNIFPENIRKNIIFVDNRAAFEQALKTYGYSKIFIDHFAWDFGHCTRLGNQIIGKHAAAAVEQYINSQPLPARAD